MLNFFNCLLMFFTRNRLFICLLLFPILRVSAENSDTIYNLKEFDVVGFYRSNIQVGNIIDRHHLVKSNRGQEPSFILSQRPSIFAYSDTGNEYGYSYFRIRGMDQTRVNMTMDGMPLNEGEDMGVYFSNYPDVLSSLHSIKVESGAGISGNGVAGYAGSIDFESVDLKTDTVSSAYINYGSYNTFKSNVEYNSGVKGNWAVHLKATIQQSDGFRENAYNNSQSVFAKVGYFIDENHSIDFLSFFGLSRNGSGWIGSTMDEIDKNDKVNGCTDVETDKFMQNINKLQYKGLVNNNMTLTASVYYNHLKGHYYFDLDNYMKKVVDTNWATTGEIDCYNLRHHMIGGNAAIKLYLPNLSITTGVNASTFSRRHIGTNNLQTENIWNNKGYKNDLNTFAKFEYDYNKLRISGNLQYRHADFDYRGNVDFKKVNWDFLNWAFSLSYRLNTANSVYAKLTETHREPTRSDMFGGEENLNSLVTTKEESVHDFEIGYNVSTSNLIANLNLYYMDFCNELILNGEMGTNGLPLRENVDKSYRTGLEACITYTPISRLKLVNTTSFSINKVETEDETLNHTMSPNWLINQIVSYCFKNIEVGIDMRYRSKMYFDITNKHALDSSIRFGFNASWTYNDIICGLQINNIFNERSFSNGMMGATGPLYFIDALRNYHFNIRWIF